MPRAKFRGGEYTAGANNINVITRALTSRGLTLQGAPERDLRFIASTVYVAHVIDRDMKPGKRWLQLVDKRWVVSKEPP